MRTVTALMLAAFVWQSAGYGDEVEPRFQKAFDWIDQRDVPDLADKPLIHVRGRALNSRAPVLGFLLSDDEETIRWLSFSLDVVSSSRKTTDHQGTENTLKFERIDFDQRVKEILRSPSKALQKDLGRNDDSGVALFLLARACAAKGDARSANRLCELSIAELNRHQQKSLSLANALARKLSYLKTWHAVEKFGDTSISRADLLKEFRRIFRHYPQSQHHDRVKETVIMLERMVREDEAYEAAKNPNKQQTIADLIHRLRDQNGQQFSQPGSCDIFWTDRISPPGREKEKSPAWQLKEIGYDAIPQLIAALDDKRFTRSVGYHRNFYFSHHVLRVGDCAETIICEIAGRRFYQRKHTNGAMQKDGATLNVRKQIEMWWRQHKELGEEQVLIEAVRVGDEHSPPQAERLVQRYTSSAVDAIDAGLQATKKEWHRTGLIQSTRDLPTTESLTQILNREMVLAPDLMSRVTAAEQLSVRGDTDATHEMMKQWKEYLETGEKIQEIERLVHFFAKANSEVAIELVADDFAKLPIAQRLKTVNILGDAKHSFSKEETKKSLSAAVHARIDSLLIQATRDPSRRLGMSGSWGGFSYSDPRICDFAGFFLSKRGDYKFDFTKSQLGRDAELQRIRNEYLLANGEPLEEVVPPKSNPGLSPEQIDPLIDQIVEGKNSDRDKAIAAIRKLGMPALPALAEKLEQRINVNAAIRSLCNELANRITVVEIKPDASSLTKTDATTRVQFGKPLKGSGLTRILARALNELPAEFRSLTITARRDERMNGIVINVQHGNQHHQGIRASDGWTHNVHVSSGNKMITGYSGSRSGDVQEDSFKELAEAIDQAVDSPPKQEVQVILQFYRAGI